MIGRVLLDYGLIVAVDTIPQMGTILIWYIDAKAGTLQNVQWQVGESLLLEDA